MVNMTMNPQRQIYQRNEEISASMNKNNIINKKNKNKQNKKYEDINNTNIQDFNNRNNKTILIDNVPQVINSFYYTNNNNVNIPRIIMNEKNKIPVQSSMNYTEASSNNINSINNNSSSMKNLKLKKPKPKRYNCIFNKTTLQVLENLTITNEDKLIYILNNFKNIRIDPLIIKVLEERKSKKRIGLYESMLSEEQNTSSGNDKEKTQKKIINNNPNKNGIQNTQNK